MEIDSRLKSLRITIRLASKNILSHLFENYISRNNLKTKNKNLCVFCGSAKNLTKEHVLPKWAFEHCPIKYFVTDVNGQNQTYNKATVPACANCNNNLLSYLERYVVDIFKKTDLEIDFFSENEIHNIIRWLEIIEYKFHILEAIRKFIASKEVGYIPYLADFPISVMRSSTDFSPTKAMSQIRQSQKRIIRKSKEKKENSLIIFKTKNTSFHFFHQLNDFIFIELPEFKTAIFYFYNRTFESDSAGYNEAMVIIKRIYNS